MRSSPIISATAIRCLQVNVCVVQRSSEMCAEDSNASSCGRFHVSVLWGFKCWVGVQNKLVSLNRNQKPPQSQLRSFIIIVQYIIAYHNSDAETNNRDQRSMVAIWFSINVNEIWIRIYSFSSYLPECECWMFMTTCIVPYCTSLYLPAIFAKLLPATLFFPPHHHTHNIHATRHAPRVRYTPPTPPTRW